MGHPNLATLLAILITAVVYAVFLFLLKTFSKSDILLLPKGDLIYRGLTRLKLMK